MKKLTIAGRYIQVTQYNETNLQIKYRKHTYYMPGTIDDPLLRTKLAIKLAEIDENRGKSREYWTNNADRVLAETT